MLEVVPGEPLPLELDQPGVYTVAEVADGATLFTGRLAVNAGAPIESDLAPRALPAPQPVARAPGEGDEARPLWPWLAAVALAVLMLEWAYVHGGRRALSEG